MGVFTPRLGIASVFGESTGTSSFGVLACGWTQVLIMQANWAETKVQLSVIRKSILRPAVQTINLVLATILLDYQTKAKKQNPALRQDLQGTSYRYLILSFLKARVAKKPSSRAYPMPGSPAPVRGRLVVSASTWPCGGVTPEPVDVGICRPIKSPRTCPGGGVTPPPPLPAGGALLPPGPPPGPLPPPPEPLLVGAVDLLPKFLSVTSPPPEIVTTCLKLLAAPGTICCQPFCRTCRS